MREWVIGIVIGCCLSTLGCSESNNANPGLSFANTDSSGNGTTSNSDETDSGSSDAANDTSDETDSTDQVDGTDGIDATNANDVLDATDNSDSSSGNDNDDTADGTDGDDNADPCGDGVCADDETSDTCPVDCKSSGAAVCLEEKCADDLMACTDEPKCLSIYACLLSCTEQACSQQCFVDADPNGISLMNAALQCGQLKGCFGGPECGDGICSDEESVDNCEQDCGQPPCLQSSCPTEFSECQESESCAALYGCWSTCDDSECQTTCFTTAPPAAIALMQTLLDCGEEEGCNSPVVPECGDGTCSSGETSESCPADCSTEPTCGNGECDNGETAETCPDDCGQSEESCSGKCLASYQQGLPCQCDELCLSYGDCCSDFINLCAEDNAFLCILNKCGVSGDCAGDNGCNAGVKCVAACEEGQSCVDDCVDDTPNNAKEAVSGYGECAIDQGCIPDGSPGSVCGNEECEDDETPESCPADCSCGDGTCGDDETPESCPADCSQPTDPTCAGICLAAYDESAACQCDEFCLGFGDCCTDFEALCYDTNNPLLCILSECNVGSQCANDNGCNNGIQCLADCQEENSQQCVAACVDDAPNNDKEEITEFGACAIAEGCIGPSTSCGNGTCDDGESSTSCPADCTCGNGLCDSSESFDTCPADCQCGNSICDDGETAVSCAQDCKCGNGTCDAGETFSSCPADCTCGNGLCDATETPASCPGDCSGQSFDVCVLQNCEAELQQCTSDFTCLMTLSCISACDSDETCIVECFPDGNTAFDGLKTCAASVGCLE